MSNEKCCSLQQPLFVFLHKSGCKGTLIFPFGKIFWWKNVLFRVFCLILPAMLVKSEAVVLHSMKYGDARVIVDVFTRVSGRLSLIASLPRSPRARLKKQYFQPMTLLELEYDEHEAASLQRLKDASLLLPYATIPFSPEKLALSLFVAEFLFHALRSEQRNEPLFSYIADSMQWLDVASAGYANFHLTFLMHTSRFLGFYPNLELNNNASGEVYFDLREGRFCRVAPLHHDVLQPAEAGLIRLMMRMDFSTMHLYRLSRTDRNRIVEVLLHYYRLHIPHFPELRSFTVLRELYGDISGAG